MVKAKKQNLLLNIQYATLHMCLWIAMASETIFAVSLLKSMGFDYEKIGIIMAAKYLTAVISQMYISNLVDSHSDKLSLKRVICFLCVVSFSMTVIFLFFHFNFILTILCYAVFGISINGLIPYVNAIAARFTESGKTIYYSLSRGVGSLAWGLASVALGFCVNILSVKSILVVQAVAVAALFIFTLIMEDIPQKKRNVSLQDSGQTKAHSFIYIFARYRAYTLFLIAVVCLFIGYSIETTFLVNIVQRTGGGNIELGYVELLQSVCELVPAFVFLFLKKYMKMNSILRMCAVFAFFHTFLILMSSNIYILLAAQLPQILGIGIFWAAGVEFVCESLPQDDWVKGQALVNICSLGIAGIIASIISGSILDAMGVTAMLAGCVIVSGAGVVLMMIAMIEPLSKNLKHQAGKSSDCL
jgi:MFS transporter, PPP family, 3-phenylpropionic acid transporter